MFDLDYSLQFNLRKITLNVIKLFGSLHFDHSNLKSYKIVIELFECLHLSH